MKTSSKLVFFGTEDFSAHILRHLIDGGYVPLAVVTKPDAPAGRGRKLKKSAVKEVAERANIRLFQPEKIADILNQLNSLKPTHGILMAYGKILPKEIIDIFAGGIINVHPSLLPKYRGPSPIETAILNGDTETGISLIKLTEGIDEGLVYAQKKLKITPVMDRIFLTNMLAQECATFLLNKLPEILDGSLQPMPQSSSKVTYTRLLKKSDGLIDIRKPAQQLEREVRAYAGWPKSRLKINEHEIIITRARVAKDKNDGSLIIECNPGYLEILELIGPSGRKMSGSDFLRGYS